MAEDFNDLLDQTETRAQALTLEADKAIELLDSVDTMLDNLSSTIEESANETKASFDTLSEQITTAEDTLQTQQETARESMNGLMQQVQDAGGKIQASLTNAFNKFGELQTKQQEFLSDVEEELGNASNSFRELGQKSDESEDNIIAKSELFEEGIEIFTNTMSSGTEEDLIMQNLLSNQLFELAKLINTLDITVERQVILLEEINYKINDLQSALETTFNKSITPEIDSFIFSLENVGETAEKVSQSFIEFTSASEDMEEILYKKMTTRIPAYLARMKSAQASIYGLKQIYQALN